MAVVHSHSRGLLGSVKSWLRLVVMGLHPHSQRRSWFDLPRFRPRHAALSGSPHYRLGAS